MALVGEEALNEIWNLVKIRTTEIVQKYKYYYTDTNLTITIFRQMNICIIRISSTGPVTNFETKLPEGFYPEESISQNGISVKLDGNLIINIAGENIISLSYVTSDLLPNNSYKTGGSE